MKQSGILTFIGSILIVFSIGSAIIVGLTFVPWELVIKYPLEFILILDIPLFIIGITCGLKGVELDKAGK